MQNIIILIMATLLLLQAAQATAAPGFDLDLKDLKKPLSPPVITNKTVYPAQKKKRSATVKQPVSTTKKAKKEVSKQPASANVTAVNTNTPSELALKGGDACQLGERLAVAVARPVPAVTLLHNLPLEPLAAVSYDQLSALITCNMPEAEAYTYARLLAVHEVQLVNIRKDETTGQVAQRIINALALPYQREEDGSRDGVLVYLFPADQERQRALRLTIHP